MASEGAQKVKDYHEQALKYVNEALNLDEKGNSKESIHLYHKGLRCLITGLSINCSGANCAGPSWDEARALQERMKRAKVQVQDRLNILLPSAPVPDLLMAEPSKPPKPPPPAAEQTSTTAANPRPQPPRQEVAIINGMPKSCSQEFWEDVSELILLEDAVNMFFVSEKGHVTTLAVPQTLRIFQFSKEHEDWPDMPPAFLQCGRWMFPLVPGKSPVLNSESRSYMFPDVKPDPKQKFGPNGFSCVGIVLGASVTDEQHKRFERILTCYSDFRGYSTPSHTATGKPLSNGQVVPLPVYQPPAVIQSDEEGKEVARADSDAEKKHWSTKVSEGITVGAEAIAWGVCKGAQLGSQLVSTSAVKVKSNIKQNEQPTRVDPEVENNIRLVKSATGAAVQISSTLVATVGMLASQFAKQIAPILVDQGNKHLPKSVNTDEKRETLDGVVKVAASGARGLGIVYDGLEQSGRLLYKSIQKATVETVDYKYGEAVGRATNDAMGAFGNCLQTYWNVDQLGVKAIAKSTAKSTGKEVLFEGERRQIKDS